MPEKRFRAAPGPPIESGDECVREDACVSTVQVRAGVGRNPVIEGNRAIARWGGEQPEVNSRSVG